MADESEQQGLSQDELEEQEGEALPEREAMSVISPDGGVGIHDLELGAPPPEVPDDGQLDY